MTFYFDRETGKRVSKAKWARSKSHGGTRYVRRRATPSPKAATKGNATSAGAAPLSNEPPATQGSIAPSETPRTWQEWEKQAREKIKRRGGVPYDLFDFDNGVEYETGVDY